MQASNVENLLIEINSFVGKILTKTIYVINTVLNKYNLVMPSSRAGSSFFSTAKKRMQKMPPLLKKLLKINTFH